MGPGYDGSYWPTHWWKNIRRNHGRVPARYAVTSCKPLSGGTIAVQGRLGGKEKKSSDEDREAPRPDASTRVVSRSPLENRLVLIDRPVSVIVRSAVVSPSGTNYSAVHQLQRKLLPSRDETFRSAGENSRRKIPVGEFTDFLPLVRPPVPRWGFFSNFLSLKTIGLRCHV